MNFEPIRRQELIVWMYTLKHLKTLKQYGTVHYASQKMRYVVLYVPFDKQDDIIAQLNRQHFIKKVEKSYRDTIDMTFKDAIPNRIDPNMKQKLDENRPIGETDALLRSLATELKEH